MRNVPVVFGDQRMKNFGKVSADRVKFVDDICAAAKGYEYLAEAQLKAELGL